MRKLAPQKRDNSVSPRGQQAVSSILTAARDVLVEEGYPRLTMRNVAQRAGITVGNLSYYYGNKQDLLHDLLEAVIQGYMEDFDRITEDTEKSPDERFGEIVRFIIADLATKETTCFFPAMWALANHDDLAARELNIMYEWERNALAKVIALMRPDLQKKDRDLLALFVSGAIEGQTMFVGYRREKAANINEIANIAAHAFTHLVQTIDARTIRGLTPVAKNAKKRLAS